MVSSNFNPMRQSHFSFNPSCKYQSPANGIESHCFFFHIITISNLRKHKTSLKSTTFQTNQRQFGSGSPSVSSCFKRVDKRSRGGAVVEEKREKKDSKNGYVKRESVKSGGKREMGGSDFSPLRSRDEVVVATETKLKPVVDEKDKKDYGRSENRSKVGDVNMVNNLKNEGPKKANADSLRLLLDMCSKRGDVLGAISIYDSACREGIELGLHHYTVLLYLCSSAAVGIVRPAKSGSGNRSIDKVVLLPNDISNTESAGLSENCEMGNATIKDRMPVPALSDENLVKCNNFHGENRVLSQNEQFDQEDSKIQVSEDVKRYALKRGFEIYESMCLKKVPINEASLTSVARLAMAMGDGNMAFDMVKQMKTLGIKPRLRSYGPALLTFCKTGDLKEAFMVERHMLENGVYPEEPELEALLRLSVEARSSEKVYYLLHKLRMGIRKVSSSTADLIERWFQSAAAARVGKRKWDQRLIMEAIENVGGGWHGKGWLGRGKWTIVRTSIGTDGVCKGCGEKLVTIDLDPTETQNFANSVASIASQREKNSSFIKFQEWLDYHGPFEAVIDAANVGLFNQRRFVISKVNAIVNAIRQKLPSKKWPLIVVHNKRITGRCMEEPANKMLLEKWKTAEALYLTPTGSNDDWYWLFAAIKFKCLLVTNDEMRDHIFQLLGNDFFPRWKERHQVRFSFRDGGPELHMPPPCSVVIQESEKGYWHIPVVSEHDLERERTWLCATRANTRRRESEESHLYQDKEENVRSDDRARINMKLQLSDQGNGNGGKMHQNIQSHKELYKNLRSIMSNSVSSKHQTLVSDIEAAEKLGGCIIDFQI